MPIILIFGGSQGAQKINEAVIGILENKMNKDYQIIWATGPKQFDIIKEGLEIIFVSDYEEIYRKIFKKRNKTTNK